MMAEDADKSGDAAAAPQATPAATASSATSAAAAAEVAAEPASDAAVQASPDASADSTSQGKQAIPGDVTSSAGAAPTGVGVGAPSVTVGGPTASVGGPTVNVGGPAWELGMDPGDGPVETDVDEMMREVSQKAALLSKNVASLASTAGQEAANVVNNLSEKVSGFGTGFASLFSVFDSEVTTAVPSTSAPSSSQPQSQGQLKIQPQKAASAPVDHQRRVASRAIDLQANFGLPPEESLLEAFPCKLLQSYSCAHNSFTPDIPKAFNGTLYITEKNVCFLIDQNERRIPITLAVKDLLGVSREHPRGAKKGDPSTPTGGSPQDQLKIRLSIKEGDSNSGEDSPSSQTRSTPQWMLLTSFQSNEDIDSAQALMEHLTGTE